MRFQERYQKIVLPQLLKDLQIANRYAAPRLLKATVNVGVGRHSKEAAYLETVQKTLTLITGQKPVLQKARRSIAAFKVRQGDIVGVTVTLRGPRLGDFVDKLINVTLPRVRDFRGLNLKQVDQNGNLSIGFREQFSFPEIKAEDVDITHGLEINLTCSAKSRAAGLALWQALGFPFIKK